MNCCKRTMSSYLTDYLSDCSPKNLYLWKNVLRSSYSISLFERKDPFYQHEKEGIGKTKKKREVLSYLDVFEIGDNIMAPKEIANLIKKVKKV